MWMPRCVRFVSDSSWMAFLERTIHRRKSLPPKADGEGFEPPVPCGTPVFKTGAFDHSATRPSCFFSRLFTSLSTRVADSTLKPLCRKMATGQQIARDAKRPRNEREEKLGGGLFQHRSPSFSLAFLVHLTFRQKQPAARLLENCIIRLGDGDLLQRKTSSGFYPPRAGLFVGLSKRFFFEPLVFGSESEPVFRGRPLAEKISRPPLLVKS